MIDLVRSVEIVSDGILVEFGSGIHCYYPASFLFSHLLTGSNQVFLSHDPSALSEQGELQSLSTAGLEIYQSLDENLKGRVH